MSATRILAFCLSWAAGACYQTPQPDCGFVCGRAGECPEGYQCASDNRCHREGTPPSLMCAPPDAAPRDVMVADAPPDEGSLSDGDATPPTVTSTSPADSATGVSRTTTITVVFSETVQNVTMTSFTVTVGANAVSGTITELPPDTYVFTPDSMLMPNATVAVMLTSAINDLSFNALAPVTFSFETGN